MQFIFKYIFSHKNTCNMPHAIISGLISVTASYLINSCQFISRPRHVTLLLIFCLVMASYLTTRMCVISFTRHVNVTLHAYYSVVLDQASYTSTVHSLSSPRIAHLS